MHTTAHPDDEHGGLLAMLSRGEGARVSLLTLNRGEAGDNAIGPELFDPLGLIRTEELLRADQYYGVDAQYFTTVIDYGFSKRLEEALVKWGRENVLRDVVRVIRMERPLDRDRALSRERARWPRQPSDRRPDHAGGLQGRGRSERLPGTDSAGAAAVAAAEAVHGRDAGERGLDAARRSRPSTARGWATRTRTSRAPASASSARRTAAATIRSRARRTATTSGWRRRSPPARRKRASSTASTRSITGLFTTLKHPAPANALGAARRDSSRKWTPRSRRSGWTIRQPPCRRWRAGWRPRASAVAATRRRP